MNMYILVCLTDLQNDFMNPHDTANQINKLVKPEVLFHLVVVVITSAMRRFGLCAMHLPVLLYSLKLYSKKEIYVDVTEIFNVLDREKKNSRVESCFLFRRFYNNDVSISGRGSAHDDDGFGEEDCGASFARRRELEFISPLDFNPKERAKALFRVLSVVVEDNNTSRDLISAERYNTNNNFSSE